jgi:hypothetical protein
MIKTTQDQDSTGNKLSGTSALIDRLHQVRRRKRAFHGQAMDRWAAQRRLAAEQLGKRER